MYPNNPSENEMLLNDVESHSTSSTASDENSETILKMLQSTTETVVARIERYVRENDDSRTFAFLKSKQEKLMKISRDIQVVIDNISDVDLDIDEKVTFFNEELYWELINGKDKKLSEIADYYLENCIREASHNNIEIVIDNHNNQEKNQVTLVGQYQTLAGLQENPEKQIERNLADHFSVIEYQPLNKKFLRDLLERFEAKLSAGDLITGVYQLLEKHNIKISRKELFENIILGCKVLFDVRKKYAIFSVTHPSFNQLNEKYRKELWSFSKAIKDELYDNKKKVIRRPLANPCLEKLKIKEPAWLEKALQTMSVFGISDCGEVATKAFKLLLEMRADKVINLVGFEKEKGDHGFLIIDSKNPENDEKIAVVDIWSGEVYAGELLNARLHDFVHDQKRCLNTVKKYEPVMQKLESVFNSEDLTKIKLSHIKQQTLNAFTELTQAAKEAQETLNKQLKEYELTKEQRKSLSNKIDDLSDYVDNIKFITKEITNECAKFSSTKSRSRIILIDEFNEQIEDFYKKLMAILTVRESSSRFFVDNAVKHLLHVAKADAEKSILSDIKSLNIEDYMGYQQFSA